MSCPRCQARGTEPCRQCGGRLVLSVDDAILDQHGGTVMKTVKALGCGMTTAEVEEIIYRLVGVKESPEFRIEHNDLHY